MNRSIGNPNRIFTDGVKLYELDGQSIDKIIDCFEDRITNWYFRFARKLTKSTQSNFMLVATCCILIDLFSQYIYGDNFSSARCFKRFVREYLKRYNRGIKPPIKTLVHRDGEVKEEKIIDVAEGLYAGFRCGVVHSARILEFGRINRENSKNAIILRKWRYAEQNGIEIQINPVILLDDLERIFKNYLKKLRKGDVKLVDNFKKKFKFEYGISF